MSESRMQITIFDIPEREIISNKSQKEIEYDNIKQNSKMAAYHFDNFLELEQQINHVPKSNILSVLCKYALQYFRPIISASVSSDEEQYAKNQSQAQSNNFGTFASRTRRKSAEKVKLVKYKANVQSTRNTKEHYALSVAKLSADEFLYDLPLKKQVRIVGIHKPKYILRYYDKSVVGLIDEVSIRDLIATGRFTLINPLTWTFIQQKFKPMLGVITRWPLFQIIKDYDDVDASIYFENEEHAQSIIHEAILDIELADDFYAATSVALMWYSHDELQSITQIDPQSWSSKVSCCTYDQKLLHAFIPEKITYDIDAYIRLKRESKLIEYQLARERGLGPGKSQANQPQNQNANYIDDTVAKKLKFAKMQSIAYDKYGIVDLSELTDKQVRIINLEYAKLEKNTGVDNSPEAIENQKLFYRLRKSFLDLTSERLEKALKEISIKIKRASLETDELLAGGVCPHVYFYGTQMLKNFGKPWLNTELRRAMIEQYALPGDLSGYFCKICGEMISDADTEGIPKFQSAENRAAVQDDPLQTLIWKEAMFIISSYVKFTVPVPIKPLVNSLASGLRGILAEEEVNLYKNKTNMQSNIRDTINLYAAIYIYAALCAIMLGNPKGLMFAKVAPVSSFSQREKGRDTKAAELSSKIAVKTKNRNDESETPLVEYDESDAQANPNEQANQASGQPNVKIKYDSDMHKHGKALRTRLGRGEGEPIQDDKLYERYLLTTALNLILITKEIVINKLSIISVDAIKQIFLKKAYVWAKTYSKPTKFTQSYITESQELDIVVNTDSFYTYLYYMKIINGERVLKTDIAAILGRSVKKIEEDLKQGISLYDTVQIPAFKDKSRNTLRTKYSYDSFIAMYEYITQKIWQQDYVPMSAVAQGFTDKYAYLFDMQREINRDLTWLRIRPITKFNIINDIQNFNLNVNNIDLSKHYCPNGDTHKTGSYIFSKKKSIEIAMEITKKEILAWLATASASNNAAASASNNANAELKLFDNLIFTNERCVRCKELIHYAPHSSRDDETLTIKKKNLLIQKEFKKIDDVLAFYQYYDTRCPKGNLHDITEGRCPKCGFQTETGVDAKANIKERVSYYEKFIDDYRKIEHKKNAIVAQYINSFKKASQPAKLASIPYKFSLQFIAEWSQVLDVKYNILVNIGLSEGYKYHEIEKAQVNPSQSEDGSKIALRTQAMRVKDYLYQIIRYYNLIQNKQYLDGIPLEMKDILTAYGQNIKLPDLSKEFSEFNKLDAQYRTELDAAQYANFVLEHLAAIIIKIHASTSQNKSSEFKQMILTLCKYFTKNIILQETFFSKAEPVFAAQTDPDAEEGDDDVSNTSEITHVSEISDTSNVSNDTNVDVAEETNETFGNDINYDDLDVENEADVWDVE